MSGTFKAAVIEKANGPFVVKQVPHRELQPTEVLIKVEACGICHSDSLTVTGHFPGIKFPRVPGHEIIGIVEKVGSLVPASRGIKAGVRVGRGWHGHHCFGCDTCQRGNFILCQNRTVSGIHDDGGYAEYVYAPWQSLAIVPNSLPPTEAGPLMCAGVTVFNSLRNQKIMPPALIAVLGIGGLGHLAIQFAAKMGYEVVAVSSSGSKEKLAKELGAKHYIDSSKGDAAQQLKALGGANAIIATAFSAKAQKDLYNGLANDGVLVVLGIDMEGIGVNSVQLIGNRGKIIGWPSGSPMDSQDTLNFAAHNGVKTVVETFPLDRAQEAYDRMMDGKANFRAVLTP